MTNAADSIITRPYSQKNLDYAHGEAIKEDEARRAEVVQVTPSGLVITRGMLEDEIRSAKANRPAAGGRVGAYFPGWHGVTEMGW